MVLLLPALSFPLISPSSTHSIRPSELNFHRTSLKQPRTFHGRNICNSCYSQKETPSNPPLNQSVLAIILDDGSETKLYPLTKRISKGAIPIAANYRLIDIVVSNCINSSIVRINALTQFNSTSLNSHLSRAYSHIGLGKDGFVEVLTAYQSPEEQGWFKVCTIIRPNPSLFSLLF